MNSRKTFTSNKLFLLGIFIALVVAFFDLLTKRWVFALLDKKALELGVEHYEIHLTNFFAIVKVWNRGVSFGMFNGLENSHIIFTVIQGVIAIALCFWLFYNEKRHYVYALGLIIGGALGNVADRIKNGAVADFLDFHINAYHWPAFNLADSCVFIGVMILIFDDLIFKKK